MNIKPLSHSPEFIALCNDAKSRITEVSTDEVKTLLEHQKAFYLIDVREKEEFSQSHLPSSLFLSKGWIEAKIHHLVKDKASTIVLYCGSGNRSALAADNLRKMGYKNVQSMSGGIKKWIQEHKSIINSKK